MAATPGGIHAAPPRNNVSGPATAGPGAGEGRPMPGIEARLTALETRATETAARVEKLLSNIEELKVKIGAFYKELQDAKSGGTGLMGQATGGGTSGPFEG